MSQNRNINWYIDTKPTITEHIGTSSNSSVVEKVLIEGREKKKG